LFDVKNPELRILPIDTQGTQDGAIAAMNKAVAAKAGIVLGPLFSSEALAIAPIAKRKSIPVVSFSNNVDLTKQDLFVFGFMPQQQIKRVLEYSLRKGIRNFYAITPEGAFGDTTLQTFDLLKQRGDFNLHVTSNYNPQTNQGMVEAARTAGLLEGLVGLAGDKELDSKMSKRWGRQLQKWRGRQLVDGRGRRFVFSHRHQKTGKKYPLTFLKLKGN
jgi:hypothetical protein